jgi:hypothetical protein
MAQDEMPITVMFFLSLYLVMLSTKISEWFNDSVYQTYPLLVRSRNLSNPTNLWDLLEIQLE